MAGGGGVDTEAMRTLLVEEREALLLASAATAEDRAPVELDQQAVGRLSRIGAGLIGREPFTWIVQDPRFDEMPLILETPESEHWAKEIAELQRLAAIVTTG